MVSIHPLPRECLRCGECCRFLVSPVAQLSPAVIEWFITTRAARIEGPALLIEHPCQFLEYDADDKATCRIHDKPEYPKMCRIFDGSQSESFYIPPKCGMRH